MKFIICVFDIYILWIKLYYVNIMILNSKIVVGLDIWYLFDGIIRYK